MKTRQQPRKCYVESSGDESPIHSSEEREYNSETTEESDQVLSQDREFIIIDQTSSDMTFNPSSTDYESQVNHFQETESSTFHYESTTDISNNGSSEETGDYPCFGEFSTVNSPIYTDDSMDEVQLIDENRYEVIDITSGSDNSDVEFVGIIKKI